MNSESIKKTLIAFQDKQQSELIEEEVKKTIPKCKMIHAHDGSEAIKKIMNDPPNLIISAIDLPIQNGINVADWLINDSGNKLTAVILCGMTPDNDYFIDQVITKQVQFLSDCNDITKFKMCIENAISFSTKNHEVFATKKLKTGELLIKQGEVAQSVFIVRTGKLEAISESEGKVSILGEVDGGEFVGEMAYINGSARNATVRALTDCELIEIPITIMDKVLFQKPAWSKALMKTLTKRVASANQKKAS
jgi:CRP/FNR family transcriptional regulator, cyclic AMP receptor protein